jgi:hypothetical protein
MPTGNYIYKPQYKEMLFYQWWKSGKPTARKFILEISPQDDGKLPNLFTLNTWIENEWVEKAEPLDNEIREKFEKELVAEKIAMYREQANQAHDLRLEAFQWLKENIDQLTPSVAVRLWEKSIEIEHIVSGIPEALEKLMNMSDQELLDATANALLESGDSDELLLDE